MLLRVCVRFLSACQFNKPCEARDKSERFLKMHNLDAMHCLMRTRNEQYLGELMDGTSSHILLSPSSRLSGSGASPPPARGEQPKGCPERKKKKKIDFWNACWVAASGCSSARALLQVLCPAGHKEPYFCMGWARFQKQL